MLLSMIMVVSHLGGVKKIKKIVANGMELGATTTLVMSPCSIFIYRSMLLIIHCMVHWVWLDCKGGFRGKRSMLQAIFSSLVSRSIYMKSFTPTIILQIL
ncbi:uncharacterized protein LOC114260930 isoform X3 [Camellia sinensis]|uniref:uncharacterized protein LOC114260930 isoform X3 n=1 Tax=Camellia sinensis TaxID=4442 RepID=UPI001035BCC2|nr:uncharacterized protein LOC114260930 isoform X3 [Camellia sinensis]